MSSGIQRFEADAGTIRFLRRQAFTEHPNSEDLIVALLRRLQTDNHLNLTLRQARARRVIVKTLEYIDAHLDAEIRIADLCRVAEVSVSTLERVFRHELHMTPLAYIRSRRLDAVRRLLINGDPDTPISRLAHDHGISHMSRFAADYRKQFGNLPSEDRPN